MLTWNFHRLFITLIKSRSMKKIFMMSYFHNDTLFQFFEYLTTLRIIALPKLIFTLKPDFIASYVYTFSKSENRIKKSQFFQLWLLFKVTNMSTNVYTLYIHDVIGLPWQPWIIEYDFATLYGRLLEYQILNF